MSRTIREALEERGWTERDFSERPRVEYIGDHISISPGRYIEDRSEWESLQVDLPEIVPEGATLRDAEYGDEMTVSYDESGNIVDGDTTLNNHLMRANFDVFASYEIIEED